MRPGGIDYELQAIRMLAMSPTLIVMFVGVVLAVRRLPLHPRSCWALIASLMLSAFNSLGLPILLQLAMHHLNVNGFQTTRELYLRTVIFTLPHAVVAAISWGLIFVAVFDRPTPPKFLDENETKLG